MLAYRGWRRQWGQARKCGGALVWQLNDCWPVTPWAIIDFFLRKKPAYYAMSRVLRPIAVGVRRKHHDWSVRHARPAKTLPWELWAVSSKTAELVAEVELRFISISTGEDIKEKITKEIKVAANGSTDIANGMIDNLMFLLLEFGLMVCAFPVMWTGRSHSSISRLKTEEYRSLNMVMSFAYRRRDQRKGLLLRRGKGC
jgi:hypothetical protein